MIKGDAIRINTKLSAALVNRIDQYAEENHITRTAAMSVIISTFFRQDDAIKAIQRAADMNKQ